MGEAAHQRRLFFSCLQGMIYLQFMLEDQWLQFGAQWQSVSTFNAISVSLCVVRLRAATSHYGDVRSDSLGWPYWLRL